MSPLHIVLIVLIAVGVILSFIGGIMMIIVAFRESSLWGFMVLLFSPVASLCFLFTHWQKAKKAFLLQVLGSSFLLLAASVSTRVLADDMSGWMQEQIAITEGALSIELQETTATLVPIAAPEAVRVRSSDVSMAPGVKAVSGDDEYIGMKLDEIQARRGTPKAVMRFEGKTVYMYDDMEFLSEDGVRVSGAYHR